MLKVSIITTTYNSQSTISDCMDSISCQTYKNIEHIIIDGGSNDRTLEIINRKKITNSKVVSENDNGPYDAFNKGLKMVTGDIIGFVHSDDYLAKDSVVDSIVSRFNKNDIDSLYGDLDYISKNDKNLVVRRWRPGNYKRINFIFGWMPPHPTIYIKKEIYQKYGLFNISFGTASDYELIIRFFYKYRISSLYLPKTITKMRTGGLSNSSFFNRVMSHLNDWKAWRENKLSIFPFWVILKPIRKIPQFFNFL